MQERVSGLEKALQGKEDELAEHRQVMQERDERIQCLGKEIGDQAKQMTEFKDTIQIGIAKYLISGSLSEKKTFTLLTLKKKSGRRQTILLNLKGQSNTLKPYIVKKRQH